MTGETISIEPSSGWAPLRLRELVRYRELGLFLVWRDLKVRYKQTVLGIGWALLQPVLGALLFSLILGHLVGVPSDGVPYLVFVLVGLVLWNLFSQALVLGGESVVGLANVITKLYFPRLLLPIASVLARLVDFAIGVVLLVPVVLIWGHPLGPRVLLALLFAGLAVLSALAVTVWISAMNVRYRDFRYVVPFMVQLWLFASPVTYPSSLLHGAARIVYALNPMATAIDGFRWALLGTPAPGLAPLCTSVGAAALVLVTGLYYFRRLENTLADFI